MRLVAAEIAFYREVKAAIAEVKTGHSGVPPRPADLGLWSNQEIDELR